VGEQRLPGEGGVEEVQIVGVQRLFRIVAVLHPKAAPLRDSVPHGVLPAVDVVVAGQVDDDALVEDGHKALGVHLLDLLKALLLLKIHPVGRGGHHDGLHAAVPRHAVGGDVHIGLQKRIVADDMAGRPPAQPGQGTAGTQLGPDLMAPHAEGGPPPGRLLAAAVEVERPVGLLLDDIDAGLAQGVE